MDTKLIDDLWALDEKVRSKDHYYRDSRDRILPAGFDPMKKTWGHCRDVFDDFLSSQGEPIKTSNYINLHSLQKEISDDVDPLEFVEDFIKKGHHVDDFHFLAQGTKTLVFLGRSETELNVYRVTSHPNSRMGQSESNRDDSFRPYNPFLVQEKSSAGILGVLNVEDLPFLNIIELDFDDRKSLNQYWKNMMKGTEQCYAPPEAAEFAISQQGVFVAIDPSDMHYSDEYYVMDKDQRVLCEQEAMNQILENLDMYRGCLPECFDPFDGNGELKSLSNEKQADRLYTDISFG